jgi:hypothetical protein
MVLDASNKHEFVRCVLAPVEAVVPECKVSFRKPEPGYCFSIWYNSRHGISAKYGCTWEEIKNSMETELWLMSELASIKDDTVCDVTNSSSFIEKICGYAGEESVSISRMDKTDAIRGYGITFNEKGHRMFLAYGDTWKRTKKFIDLPPQVDITCPICLDVLTHESSSRA